MMGLFDFIRDSIRMPEMYRDTLRSEGVRKGRELFQRQTADVPVIREAGYQCRKLRKRNKKQ